MRRATILTALAVTGLYAGALPASADDAWGGASCSQSPSPDCDVTAGTRPGHPSSHGHNSTNDPTGTNSADDEDFDCRYVPVDRPPPDGQQKESGGWFMVLCSPDGKDPDSHGPVWIPAGANTAPSLTPVQVAQIAHRRLRLPSPSIAASPSGTQLVHLPTWLWLSEGWAPSSATASVPGVSVTAVAKPMSATWSMGDGSIVTCRGAGTPFRQGSDPKASSPDCGYTYRTSSAGQAFPVTVTVRWTVTWAGAGQSGTFPDLTTTDSAAFRVTESHALNNNGG